MSKLVGLFEQFLTEDKREHVLKTYGDKLKGAVERDRSGWFDADRMTPEQVVNFWHNPEYGRSGRNGKHLVWVIRQYVKGDFRIEDCFRVRDAIDQFEQVRARLEKKDLMQYSKLSDVEDAVEGLSAPTSKRQEKQAIKKEGSEVVLDGPDCTVVRIKTVDAAKYYGKGTKWCTAAENNNMFNEYAAGGPLYVFLCSDGRKFQYWRPHGRWDTWEEPQFMDEKDNEVKYFELDRLYPTMGVFLRRDITSCMKKDGLGQALSTCNTICLASPEVEDELAGGVPSDVDTDMVVDYAVLVKRARLKSVEGWLGKMASANQAINYVFSFEEFVPDLHEMIVDYFQHYGRAMHATRAEYYDLVPREYKGGGEQGVAK